MRVNVTGGWNFILLNNQSILYGIINLIYLNLRLAAGKVYNKSTVKTLMHIRTYCDENIR